MLRSKGAPQGRPANFDAAAAVGVSAAADPLILVLALHHINIRASNPEDSAHFYQGLFGGDLFWVENIPPNPFSPPAESWYLKVGEQLISMSPTPTNRNLGPGLDHIRPVIRGFAATRAAARLKQAGLNLLLGEEEIWLRDPDEMLYQLRGEAQSSWTTRLKAVESRAPGPPPFPARAIRETAIRTGNVEDTAAFYSRLFGVEGSGVPGKEALPIRPEFHHDRAARGPRAWRTRQVQPRGQRFLRRYREASPANPENRAA